MQWWRILAISREQRFESCLAPSAAAFFIDGFLGPGTGTAWWLFFSLCRDRGKDVISWWPLPRPFFHLLVFSTYNCHFSNEWFLPLYGFLIRCLFALVLWLRIFLQSALFSSFFLLVRRRWYWCSDKSPFSFLRRWDFFSEIALQSYLMKGKPKTL